MKSITQALLAIQAILVIGSNHTCDFHRSLRQLDFIRGQDVRFNCSFDAVESLVRFFGHNKPGGSFDFLITGDGTDHAFIDFKFDLAKIQWAADSSSIVLTILNATEHYGYTYFFCGIYTVDCSEQSRVAPMILIDSK